MKFLCDVHISRKLSKRLEELGHSSIHVNDVLDKWHTKDSEMADYADSNDLIIITKDQDFRNSHLVNKRPKKLIKINLGNISNRDLIQNFETHINWIEGVNDETSYYMIEVFKYDVWSVIK